jgi:hypothetical protein
MNALERISVDRTTGSINGFCPQCRCFVSITKKVAREQAIAWFERDTADLEKQIERWRELRDKRDSARAEAIAFKDADGADMRKQIQKLRDACNALLEKR